MKIKGLLIAAIVGSIAIVGSVASASPTGPTAAIATFPATILPGDDVVLDCSPSDDGAGTITACDWTVDGNPVGSGSPGAPVHWTATWGSHTVGLTVTDDQAAPASDSTTAPITVDTPPTANPGGPYSYDLASGGGLPVTGSVDDADGSPPDFLGVANWYIDGTPVQSAPAPTTPSDVSATIPASALSSLTVGTHTLSLGVLDSLGQTATTDTTLTVGDSSPTTAVIAPFASPVTPGTHVLLDCSGSTAGGGATITGCAWDQDGTGVGSGDTSTPFDFATTWGAHTIGLTVTDSHANTATAGAPLLVDTSPTADAGGPYAYDWTTGGDLTLTGTVGDVDLPLGDSLGTYTWLVDGNPVDAGPTPAPPSGTSQTVSTTATESDLALAGLSAGTHTVALMIVDALGQPSMSAPVDLVVTGTPAPPPSYSISTDSPSYSVAQNGTVSVSVTVTPANGFTGHVDLFLNGANPGDPTPAGVHEGPGGPFGADVTDTNPVTVSFPIQADSGAAIQTDPLTISSSSGSLGANASISLDVTAPSPNWTLSVDQPSVTVPPNTVVNETVTASPLGGFTGTLGLSLSGVPDSNGNQTPPPGGFGPNGPWPSVSIGPGDGTAQIGINTFGAADGTFTVYVASSAPGSENVFTPISITVDSTIPVAQAHDNRQTNLTATADSVTDTELLNGYENWFVQIDNFDAATVPGGTIHVDTTTPALSPSPGCPCDAGPQDVAQNSWLGLDQLNGGPGNPQPRIPVSGVASGFSASRTVSGGDWSVAAGGTQTVTVHAIPQQSFGSLDLRIATNNNTGGPSYGSIEAATVLTTPNPLGPNDFQQGYLVDPSGAFADWQIGNPQVGTEYTLTVTIDVPTAGTYKPYVSVQGGNWSPQTQSTGSASIADGALGGTIQYGSSNPNAVFEAQSGTTTQVAFAADVPAPWTLAIDQPSVSVPAGGSFAEGITITPNGSATGSVFCSVNGQDDQGGTPSGVFWGPSSPISFGPGDGTGTMPIQIDQSVAVGPLVVALACDDGSGTRQFQNVTIDVGAAVPTGRVNVQRNRNLELPSSTDSVLAGDPNSGTLRWWANMGNDNALAIPAPSISLDGYDSGAWTFTPDPGPGPYTVSGASLGQGDSLELDTLNGWDNAASSPTSQVENAPITTGYDASRSFTTTTIPTGGGDEQVTVSITPTAGQYAGGYVQLNLSTSWYSDTSATIDTANVVGSTLAHGEYDNGIQASPTGASWWIGNVTPGQTYTLTVPIHVANSGPPLTYKPEVDVTAGTQQQLAAALGTSTTIDDATLGGSFTFSSSGQTSWQRQLTESVVTTFDPMTVQPYTISVDQPEVTVQQGQQVDELATLTPVNGFAGDVTLSLAGGNDPNNFTPPPAGFFQSGDWSNVTLDGTNPATKTLSIFVDGSVPQGDYTLYLDSFAPTDGSPQFTPIVVHVGAAQPQIHVGVDQGVDVKAGPYTDSVAAGALVDEKLTWNPYIFDVGTAQLTTPTISLDGSSQTLAPTLLFPYQETGGPLNHFDAFFMAGLDGGPGHSSAHRSASTGFDATRSFDSATIPPGGGTQTVTVSVTQQTATGTPGIDINTALAGATIQAASIVGPANDPDLATDGSLAGDHTDYFWSLSTAGTVGTTYTVVLTIHVPNPGTASLYYKPAVTVSVTPPPTSLGAGPDGPSTTISDPTIGTFSFSVDQTNAQWTARYLLPSTSVGFAPVAVPVVDHFQVHVDGPADGVWVGKKVNVVLTALDAGGNPVPGFHGPVTLTQTSSATPLSSSLAWSNGVGTGWAIFGAPGGFEHLTVTEPITGATGTNAVPFPVVGDVATFDVRLDVPPDGAWVGRALPVRISALDASGQPAIGYSGPVVLTQTGSATPLPSGLTWDAGIGTGYVTFAAPGSAVQLTATDQATGATGTNPVPFPVVGAVAAFRVHVDGPSDGIWVGRLVSVRIDALDGGGLPAIGYRGGLVLTQTGDSTPLVANLTWSNGVGTGTVVFRDPGSVVHLTATDDAAGVTATNAVAFAITGPTVSFKVHVDPPYGGIKVGAPVSVTLTALDVGGSTDPTYHGTVTLTASTGTVTLIGGITWSRGVGHASVTFSTAGSGVHLTATDSSSGASGTNGGGFTVLN